MKTIFAFLLILLVTNTANAWWCYEINPYTLTYCTSVSEAAKSKELHEVWYQPKAACFSFFDVMADSHGEWCSANFSDCENIHDRYVRANKDFRVLSACYAKGSK